MIDGICLWQIPVRKNAKNILQNFKIYYRIHMFKFMLLILKK